MNTRTNQAKGRAARMRHEQLRIGVACAALALGACSATMEDGLLPTGALKLPEVSLPIPSGFGGPKGTSTEIYERTARGVLTCWLGANGPLKATHMFHAVAEPARMGGLSEIVLYERDGGEERKRGAQAALIRIEPVASSANVSFRNVRLPDDQADRFNTDVYRWAAGDEGCVPSGITEGWGAAAQSPQAQSPQTKSAQTKSAQTKPSDPATPKR